jgi:hypothetical protein
MVIQAKHGRLSNDVVGQVETSDAPLRMAINPQVMHSI